MTFKSGRREKRFSPLIIRQPFSKPMTMVLPPFKQRVKLAGTQSINIWFIWIPKNNATCSSLNGFNVSWLFESNAWMPHNISILKNRSHITTVHNTKLITAKSKTLQSPQHKQSFVGLFQHIINLCVPFETVLTYDSGSEPILKSPGWRGFLPKYTWRAWHFKGFNLSILSFDHLVKSSKSACRELEGLCAQVELSANVKSSTYFQHLEDEFSAASLMRIWNPIGPNFEPWGTPPCNKT